MHVTNWNHPASHCNSVSSGEDPAFVHPVSQQTDTPHSRSVCSGRKGHDNQDRKARECSLARMGSGQPSHHPKCPADPCQVQIPPAQNTAQEWRYIPHLCKYDPCKKASCPSDPPLLTSSVVSISAGSNNLFFLSHLTSVVLNNSLYWPTGLRKTSQRTTTTQWKLR